MGWRKVLTELQRGADHQGKSRARTYGVTLTLIAVVLWL